MYMNQGNCRVELPPPRRPVELPKGRRFVMKHERLGHEFEHTLGGLEYCVVRPRSDRGLPAVSQLSVSIF